MSEWPIGKIIIGLIVIIAIVAGISLYQGGQGDKERNSTYTSSPSLIPSATFTIISFDQWDYDIPSLNKWSSYVTINYKVHNNGTVFLYYYRVDFTITCDDGSKIEDWTNGTDIFIGEKVVRFLNTEVGNKKVVSIEVTDYELRGGGTPEVIYEITGSAKKVDVTMSNATGGTEQHSYVYPPKRYSFSSFPNYFLYISSQNQGEYGTITVSIYVNGRLYKTSTSSGAYVIATASGSK